MSSNEMGQKSLSVSFMMLKTEEQNMIQDRLTAKFLNAQPVKHDIKKPRDTVLPKMCKAPATDIYTRGRSLLGTFWL